MPTTATTDWGIAKKMPAALAHIIRKSCLGMNLHIPSIEPAQSAMQSISWFHCPIVDIYEESVVHVVLHIV